VPIRAACENTPSDAMQDTLLDGSGTPLAGECGVVCVVTPSVSAFKKDTRHDEAREFAIRIASVIQLVCSPGVVFLVERRIRMLSSSRALARSQ